MRLRVGVAGLGRMGSLHARNLAGRIPGARLTRVVDADPGRAAAVGAALAVPTSTDFADLLAPDVDAVVVATPTPLHAEQAEAAAQAGKHVFCEKPVSLDLARTYAVTDAVRAAGVHLQVGFHRRFDPDYRAAHERVVRGALGRLYRFGCTHREARPPSFDYLAGSGGLFLDATLHDFDLARWFGGEVEEVTVLAGALSDPAFAAIGDVDNALVTLRFASGALGVIDNSRTAGYGYEVSSELMGESATLRVGHRPRLAVEILGAEALVGDKHFQDFVERFEAAYQLELDAFVAAVRLDQEPEVGGEDAAAACALALAAGRSLREGRSVAVRGERGEAGMRYRELV